MLKHFWWINLGQIGTLKIRLYGLLFSFAATKWEAVYNYALVAIGTLYILCVLCGLMNHALVGTAFVYRCCHSTAIKRRHGLCSTGSVSDRLTTLLDATATKLPTETIATGRNRISFVICLQLPCLSTAARATVNRWKHGPLPKHAVVRGVVVIRAVVFIGVYSYSPLLIQKAC